MKAEDKHKRKFDFFFSFDRTSQIGTKIGPSGQRMKLIIYILIVQFKYGHERRRKKKVV